MDVPYSPRRMRPWRAVLKRRSAASSSTFVLCQLKHVRLAVQASCASPLKHEASASLEAFA